MNVYDFDNTIYNGETVVDFYLFCLGRNIALAKFLPFTFVMLIRYKLGFVSLSELEKKAVKYVKKVMINIEDLDKTVQNFWNTHQHKIKSFYLNQQRPDDVIISAGCDFLLNEICNRIGIKHCLCSKIDTKTGEILQLCFRSNKPHIFYEHFKDASIDKFYTDSMCDLPMIKLAKKVYLVKGNRIKEITKEGI